MGVTNRGGGIGNGVGAVNTHASSNGGNLVANAAGGGAGGAEGVGGAGGKKHPKITKTGSLARGLGGHKYSFIASGGGGGAGGANGKFSRIL